MEPFSTKNTKNRTERNGPFSTKNRTERYGPFSTKNRMERYGPLLTKNTKNVTERGWNDWKKNERGRNDLAARPSF